MGGNRPTWRSARRLAPIGLGLALVAAAGCAPDRPELAQVAPTTTGATTTTVIAGTVAPTTPEQGLGEGTAPQRDGRSPLRGFSEVEATITAPDGETCTVCLLAATTDAQRERGLMEVTDPALGGYDGMLFRWADDQDGAFWMRNTPMPLSLAYFDRNGVFVSATDMEPCADSDDCPMYPADGEFRYAVEVPKGGLEELGIVEGSTLRIDDLRCPKVAAG